MRLADNTGINYRDALDGCLRDLMEQYHISRQDARRLFAEAISRNCVWDEVLGTCDWLMGIEQEEERPYHTM